jgi:hypothetical protein
VKYKCANSSAVLKLCFPALGSLYMLSPRFRNHLRSISGALFPHFGARWPSWWNSSAILTPKCDFGVILTEICANPIQSNWKMTSLTLEKQAKVMDCCSFSYCAPFPT